MRTIAQKTVFQRALRNCSEEGGGVVSIHVITVKYTFWQKVVSSHKKVEASHKEQMSLSVILVLF